MKITVTEKDLLVFFSECRESSLNSVPLTETQYTNPVFMTDLFLDFAAKHRLAVTEK